MGAQLLSLSLYPYTEFGRQTLPLKESLKSQGSRQAGHWAEVMTSGDANEIRDASSRNS